MPLPAAPDAALIEDFFVPGDATLGALAEIYGLTVPPEKVAMKLADYFRSDAAAGGSGCCADRGLLRAGRRHARCARRNLRAYRAAREGRDEARRLFQIGCRCRRLRMLR